MSFILTLLLGISLNLNLEPDLVANAYAAKTVHTNSLPKVRRVEYKTENLIQESDIFAKFEQKGVKLRAVSNLDSADNLKNEKVNQCAAKLDLTLSKLPNSHTSHLKNLKLYFDQDGRRGLGGGTTIIIRCVEVDDPELSAVLIHEMGHVVDSSFLVSAGSEEKSEFLDGKKTVTLDDPSLNFYQLSWKNEEQLLDKQKPENFVTGYAMSNPYEDFAETYAFYYLHGKKFREMTRHNLVLAKKYEFMRNNVFFGQEFNYDNNSNFAYKSQREYDSTVLPYNYENLLAI